MATEPDTKKTPPNILIILADDIGWFDVGAYHRGIMGGPTPNIDRIAHEGAILTDCYAQASCTAGRAALVTGQIPMRTGLTTVGMPGAPQGLHSDDPTLAELLKPKGYMTAQIGKNHLGDRNEFLPRFTGSTNSTVISTISTLRRSQSKLIIPRITRPSSNYSHHAACWTAEQLISTTTL